MTDRPTRTPLLLGLTLVALLAAAVAAVAGGGGPAGSAAVPRVDVRAQKYRLGNGLEVILRRDNRLPVVAVNLWYHVGGANDPPGRAGLAHLCEHMMFEGSGHIGAGLSDRLLEAAGTSENASTSFDYTNYIVPDLPANQLELGLWLESDRMGFVVDRLNEQSLANQQAVVRNERRENYDGAAYGLADEEVYHRLFPPGHPYYADVIGSHTDIQAAGLEDVRNFYRRYYRPNNASLAVVGDIDVARTRQLVEKYFGSIPRGPDVARPAVPAPPLSSEQRVTMTDTVQLPRVTMAWLTPPIFRPGDYDAIITKQLLGGTRASRLTRRLVHDQRIAQSVNVDVTSLTDRSVFTITATAKPGHVLAELEGAIDAELDDLARRAPTRAEVEAAATSVIAHTVGGLDDLGDFGGLADQLNSYNHYLGDPNRLGDDLRRTAAVTPGRVQRFVADGLDRNRRVVVDVVPGPKTPVDDPPAPPENDTETPVQQPPSAEAWRSTVPAPGPAPTTPLPPVRRFTLGNGLPVWLVESHDLPLVSASLVSLVGSGADPSDRPGLTDLATSALDRGTTSRDALGLSRELEAAGATLGNDTGKDGTWLTATALEGHAATTLGILGDVARHPTFPADEVDRVRDAAVVALRQDRDSGDTVAETAAARLVYGAAHPYGHRAAGTEDGVRAATVDDLRRAYEQAFTPRTTALLLAGDVTAPEARRLAEAAFGSWEGGGAAETARSDSARTGPPAPPPPAGSPERMVIIDKPGAPQTAVVMAAPGVAQSDPDYEALLVANRIFGGSFSSRLNEDLRETRGYTYGAYSSVAALRGAGLVSITMDVETPSTADAVQETFSELDRLAASGVTADELTRAKQWMTESLPANFATRAKTLGTLRTLYLGDLPPDYFRSRPARLAAISADDVGAVARRRFRPGAFTVVAVGERSAIEAPLRTLGLGPVAVGSPE